ncbi:EpsG family protein [Aeromonas veronii]
MTYYIFYIFSSIISIGTILKSTNKLAILLLSIGLSLFAGLRGPFVDRDYLNYYYLWFIDFQNISYYFFEPIPKLIFSIYKSIDAKFYFPLITFAFFSIWFKLKVVRVFDYNIPVFVTIYVGYFFFQHDMTQVRLALALGLYYISFRYFVENKKLSLIFLFLSVLTHGSTVIFAISRIRLLSDNLLMLLLFTIIVYLLNLIGLDLTAIVKIIIGLLPYFEKYLFYFTGEWSQQKINVFSAVNVSFIILISFAVIFVNRYDNKNVHIKNALVCGLLGLISIPLFSSIPVISFRLSQVYLCFIPFISSYLYTNMMRIFFNRNPYVKLLFGSFIYLVFLGYGIILMYIVIFNSEILQPYVTILTESIE